MYVEAKLTKYSQLQIILATIVGVLTWQLVLHKFRECRREGVLPLLFKAAIKLPYIRTRVDAEKQKEGAHYWDKYVKQRPDSMREIP